MSGIDNLNPQQRSAVEHDTGPLLIIAGAGTGKTTVITKRMEHLIIDQKIPSENILALTFTEKAATEMEARIDSALPYGFSNMWIETFHAFCDRILRQEAIHVGLNPKFDLLKEAESLIFLRKHLFDFELNYFRPLGNPMKFLQGMLGHFSRLKDDDITPAQYLEYANKLNQSAGVVEEEALKTMELAKAYVLYEELKTREGVMDFSDLISNTLKLLRTRKNILNYYQNLFHYILVDEFQDTNYAQNELSILLAGNKQNITVVADDDQSIYRWRGAAISNVMQFRSHFPKAKIITLTTNYRSTQTILDSAHKLIQYNNPDRLEVKENINKKLVSARDKKGEKIELLYANRGEDEADMVVKRIKEEIKKNNYNYNDFAILVRANDHAMPFTRALEHAKIPFQFLGPGHLFQTEEIKDLIAYLHTLVNFEDNSSLYRIITMPIFGLEGRDVAGLLNFSRKNNLTLFEAMEKNENSALTLAGKQKITQIVSMLKKHLEKVPRESAGQILFYFFEDSGLLGHYLDPSGPRTEREAQNIAKFFDKLQSYSATHVDTSVFAVTDWIDLSMELGESPLAAEVDWSINNAVSILTVHSSKGLEFPFVFVVNLVSQRFPSRDRREQIPVPADIIREILPTGDENLQEERRLFYVAITRAKDKLILTASKFYGDGRKERKVSPFVLETLGDEALKIIKQLSLEEKGQQLNLLDFLNANIVDKADKIVKSQDNPHLEINYISYSQLQTFLMCPLHYKLRYILNIPTSPSSALSYGVSVHSALRDFCSLLLKGETVSPQLIKQFLKQNWITQGYDNKTHETQAFARAEEMLEEYIRKTLLEKPVIKAVEMPFSFWLKNGEKRLRLGGRIDRVDQLSDNKIEIIDYKTGNNVPTQKKTDDDLQLSFYALAASQLRDNIFPKSPDNILLTLNYLEVDKKISTTRSADELEEAKEKIFNLVREIEQSSFRCSGGMMCKNCEYKMLCQSFGR